MSSPAVRVTNLSKRYRIGVREQGYKTFREAIVDAVKSPFNNLKNLRSLTKFSGDDGEEDIIWALRDINFEVKRGEVVGIIGANGAGKSTLLKILSRITEPTTGQVEIRGRVSSLLEVGTGFHPELTGRENVYLNGTVLGMRKKEIDRKFDEIVDFSGVEKFIDTPVKRYSSGMKVRLAFAVAAHLEPEILIIDEVLSVGDAAFQKKCLGKMGEAAGEGRTVLFVSHNMQAIRTLCSRSILLESGNLVYDASSAKTLSIYHNKLRENEIDAETGINNPRNRRGSGAVRFTEVAVKNVNGSNQFEFKMGDTIRFEMSYKTFQEMQGLAVSIILRSGIAREFVTSVRHIITNNKVNAGASGAVVIELPDIYIRPGEYPIYFHISEVIPSKNNLDVLDDLTHPLVVTTRDKTFGDFNPLQPVGYFSIPSKMESNEILMA